MITPIKKYILFTVDSPWFRRLIENNSYKKSSKEKGQKKVSEQILSQEAGEIKELKEIIKAMQVKIDNYGNVVKEKDEKIKELEKKLTQKGVKY